MFDPSISFDARLKNEFGLQSADFYPKKDCDEQELKYLINSATRTPFDRIRETIHSKPNRIVDSRAWVSNPYVLVTFNMDTVDQQLAEAGFSLRVRFAYDATDLERPVKQADMCIKTTLPQGRNVVMFKQTRGEWEVELPNLQPDMGKMIEKHRRSDRPLPAFFAENNFDDNLFFVESIGCTLRNIYPSYEIVQYKGGIIVPTFQHTEDVLNVFMTPFADQITIIDHEAEAEFVGIKGISPAEMNPAEFNDIMRKSMELIDRMIIGADSNIDRNLRSKSMRARMGLEHAYGMPTSGLHPVFNLEGMASPSYFALSQRVHPSDVSLESIWSYVGHEYEKHKRSVAPDFNPFQYK